MNQWNETRLRHGGCSSRLVAALAAVLAFATIQDAGAAIATANLFAHYDADAQTYANAAKRDGLTPVAAADGERVWEWWDQASGDGNHIVQNSNNTLQPFLRTNALNGHSIIDMAPVPGGTNTAGMLAIDGVDGTDSFGTAMNSNQISYTVVYQNNAPSEAASRWLIAFNYSDGLPGGLNTVGTRFENGNRFSYTLDTAGTEQGVTNDASGVGTQWSVLTVVWDGVAGTISEYVNGQLTGVNSSASNTNPLDLGRYRIGADQANTFSTRLDGSVAEVLVYSSALSDVDRAATESFLMDKYAIPEPASLALLGCAGLLLVCRRRRG